ncbi:hypothetical protein GDO78_002929 [Eleutherodactylus coqui]|uniref:Uncharacterized protein n=1 Tax=Eleutherodactylus coqui TaxID=57060 RepID=A0A8J6K274_ELECQ|nr:hypothetical protein GDO78_002929 [Eleutherodactylus coqui]
MIVAMSLPHFFTPTDNNSHSDRSQSKKMYLFYVCVKGHLGRFSAAVVRFCTGGDDKDGLFYAVRLKVVYRFFHHVFYVLACTQWRRLRAGTVCVRMQPTKTPS